jgi:hypothetical protein
MKPRDRPSDRRIEPTSRYLGERAEGRPQKRSDSNIRRLARPSTNVGGSRSWRGVGLSGAWCTRTVGVLVVVFLIAGCGQAERLLQPDQCTLAVMTDTEDGRVPIDPPYVLALRAPGDGPPTGIGFTGTGWTTVDITQLSPDGVVVDTFRGNGVDDRSVFFPMDRPGVWTFHLVDTTVECIREVKVTVTASVMGLLAAGTPGR